MIEIKDLDFTLSDLQQLGHQRARTLSDAMVIAARRLAKYANLLEHPRPTERPRQCVSCLMVFALDVHEADLERAGHPQRDRCRRCLAHRQRVRKQMAQARAGGRR